MRISWRALALELWPIIVLVFMGLIVLEHVVTTGWDEYFFYNGDSLALALLEESLQRGEPQAWVFSTQNFVFPEAPFFLLSSLFTDNPRVAFSINAVLNLVILYLLLRGIAHELARSSRHRMIEVAIALGATVLFTIFILLEANPSPNRSGIATLFVLTTYYYGVALGGLAMVLLILWGTKSFGHAPPSLRRDLAMAFMMGGLTAVLSFSNLLFTLEVVAPVTATLLVLVFLGRITWRLTGVIVGAMLGGLIVTAVLRRAFSSLFAAGVGNYLSLDSIPISIRNLYLTLVETISFEGGALKLVLIGALWLITVGGFLFALYAQARPRLAASISTSEVFLVAWVTVTGVALLVGQIMTGSTSSRYLQPLFVFPLVVFVAVGVNTLRRMLLLVERVELRRSLRYFASGLAIVASGVVVAVGALAIPTVAQGVAPLESRASCLEEFLGDSDLNGVGTFWLARTLQVYGEQRGQILQVNPDLTLQAWMVNLWSYDQGRFSYVIVDSTGILTADGVVEELGEPADVVQCNAYAIYDYRGTDGEARLTEVVRDSMTAAIEAY